MTRAVRLLKIPALAAIVAVAMFLWSQSGPPQAGAVFGDSDGDGAIDIAEQISGSDPNDTNSIPENTAVQFLTGLSVCTDGIDNDLDGLTDSDDSGCHDSDGDLAPDDVELLLGSDPNSSASFLEDSRVDAVLDFYGIPFFFCGDGADNDGDGLTDADDPGCTTIRGDGDAFDDATEKRFGSDPANTNSVPEHESPNPGSCSDGIDNDLDGLTDAADPACGVPANDARTSATIITTLPYTDGPSVVKNATAEPGEPQPSCSFGSVPASVWYRYAATQDGVLIADTAGSNFATILAVWQEGARLTEVGCDNAFNGPGDQARIAFRVSAGQTYLFQVDGFPFAARTPPTLAFHLVSGTPPANDSFSALTAIAGLPFADAVDTTAATTQFGEPDPQCSFRVESTVWYRFSTAEDMLLVAETTGSDYPAMIGAWTDSKFGLAPVACATAGFSGPGEPEVPARLALQAEAGNTYYFQLSGSPFDTSFGNLTFHLEAGIPPANDSFAGATAVTALPFSDTADTLTASVEPGEPQTPCFFGDLSATVWYRYSPASDGYLKAATEGTEGAFGTVLGIYRGTAIDQLTLIACGETFSFDNTTGFQVSAGETYYFQVGQGIFRFGKSPSSEGATSGFGPPVPTSAAGLITFHLDTLVVPACAPAHFTIDDPVGDAGGFFGPPPADQPPPLDIVSVEGGADAQSVCLRVRFSGPIPAPTSNPRENFFASALLDFDTDEDPATGYTNGGCAGVLGVELQAYVPIPSAILVRLFPFFGPGPVPGEEFVGYALFDERSFTFIIPLAALGGDDRFRFSVGVNSSGFDCAPNGGAIVSPEPALPGDANCDGQANSLDSVLILQLFANLIPSLPCQYAGDVNANGGVGPIDALLILQFDSGMLTAFPAG